MAANVQANLKKYQRNAAAAAEDYVAGVNATTTAPTAKAAAAVDKYARGVQDAVTSGRFVNGCNAVTLGDWQQSCVNKGKRNFQNGIANLSPKAIKNMADQQEYAERVRQEVANMPNDTPADADARMLRAVELMRAYRRK